MEELDGDSVRISYKGRRAKRDIVQFVAYRDANSWLSSSVGKNVRERLRPYSPLLFQQQVTEEDKLNNNNNEQEEKNEEKEKEYSDDVTHKMAQEKLAKEILAEIPEQFLTYMRSRSILPSQIGKILEGQQGENEGGVSLTVPEKIKARE